MTNISREERKKRQKEAVIRYQKTKHDSRPVWWANPFTEAGAKMRPNFIPLPEDWMNHKHINPAKTEKGLKKIFKGHQGKFILKEITKPVIKQKTVATGAGIMLVPIEIEKD